MQQQLIDKAKRIKLLILDVDGVLTDGKLFFDENGQEYKTFHARDGLGMRLIQETGIEIAAISGRNAASVAWRLENLGVKHIYQGYKNKLPALTEIMQKLSLDLAQIAYVGDDLIDLPVMTRVGLAIAVNDANPTVKNYAHWCTQNNGGQGAVREVCDFIMQAQNTYAAILVNYLN